MKRLGLMTAAFLCAVASAIGANGMDEKVIVDGQYLCRHDIVYLEPDYEGYNGFPLGNGDMGGMLWTTPEGIQLQVNKINLYDRSEPGQVVLKAAGQLKIDFGVPCNEYLYLSDFENRLSLLNATAKMRSTTAFSQLETSSWVDAKQNVWVIECNASYNRQYTGDGSVRVALERWGSRHFGDWYHSCEKDESLGLAHTQVSTKGNDLLLNDTLEGGLRFSIACRIVGETETNAVVVNRHKAELRSDNGRFFIVLSLVTSDENPETEKSAIRLIDDFCRDGLQERYAAHLDSWHRFWNKSFVNLGEGSDADYVENIYYLRRYLAGSSSRGNYPVPFNGGLWVWNHDHRQWITSVHWNTQQSCWGLAEQGDAELLKPYINTYFRLMPKAMEFAKKRHDFDGALRWTEVHDFDGNMLHQDRGDMKYNYTPASQIASVFWNYYEHTGSEVCLRDTVYPFMKASAELYLNLLEWDKERQEYFIYPAQPYEHPYTSDLKNPITDRYMIEQLFGNCIKASEILGCDAKKRRQWEHVVAHLWEPPVLDVPGKGKVFVMAYKPDGEVYPNLETYPKRQFYHCDAHTTMVFPANVLGLDQEGSAHFEIAKRIALNHPENRNAITPGAIVSARLGLGNKVMERVKNMISYLQHFNQGLFYNIDHWNVLSRYAKSVDNADLVTQRDYVFDSRCYYNSYAGNSGLWAKPFVQCGMEPINILAAAVNEMLLQSHEGKIRVFPARPDNQAMAFKLHARGGFVVSSRVEADGVVSFVEIESEAGNGCRLQNPWNKGTEVVVTDDSGAIVKSKTDRADVICFRTVKGGRYLISPAGSKVETVRFSSEANKAPKTLGEATLGKFRTFKR